MVKDLKASKKQSVKSSEPKKEKKATKTLKVSDKSKPIKKGNRMARRFNKLRLKPEQMKSRGIIYIGHLPKGFEEDELKKFFT